MRVGCVRYVWGLYIKGAKRPGENKKPETKRFPVSIGSGAWIWTMDLWGYAPAHGPNPCRPEPIIINPSGVRHDGVP